MNEDTMELYDGRKIYVPGWDDLQSQSNTIGLTLQALVNLERKYIYEGGAVPTQQRILQEVIRLGGGLSPNSQRIIYSNLKKLYELGHVDLPKGYQKRARGGPPAPWRSRYMLKMV